MELFKASKQWAERPDDERFENIDDMYDACKAYADRSTEHQTSAATLRVEPKTGSNDLRLITDGQPARLTHWTFDQLAQRVGAPANYLRSLPVENAAADINVGLARLARDEAKKDATVLIQRGEKSNSLPIARAITSDFYSRIWNYEVIERVRDLGKDWTTPAARPARTGQAGARAATVDDVARAGSAGHTGGLGIKVGDLIAPAGLYASDHDMFLFRINAKCRIDDGTAEGLYRGMFFWNAEVGGSSFGGCRYLFKEVCGNHIIWGAREVVEFRMPHIGKAPMKAFAQIEAMMTEYSNESASDEEAQIKSAKRVLLGATKEEAIAAVFGFRIPGLAKRSIEAAYTITEGNPVEYGAPNSVWGMANGLTELSQATNFTDQRMILDRAAGRLLSEATQ